jgi:hypothetical protein
MKNEIDKDFYCSAGRVYESCGEMFCIGAGCRCCQNMTCPSYHRKHPTPEQFRQEYGEDVPDDMPVWWKFDDGCCVWRLGLYRDILKMAKRIIRQTAQSEPALKTLMVVACTPFGKLGDDWRPE